MPALLRTESQKEYVAQQIAKLLLVHGFTAKPYKAHADNSIVLVRGIAEAQKVIFNVADDTWLLRIPGYKGYYQWQGTNHRKLLAKLEELLQLTTR